MAQHFCGKDGFYDEVENPCPEVPWHQVQFWTGRTSPADSEPPAERAIAKIAIFIPCSFMTRVLA